MRYKSFDDGTNIVIPFDISEGVAGKFELDDLSQISIFTDPIWILYNGDWNDTGIWIDEAIWIDGE